MSAPAFYSEKPLTQGEILRLAGAEAAHAHVARLGRGAEAQVFDGIGSVAACQVVKADKRSLELEIGEINYFAEPESRAVMAIAMSKALRRGFFMEKAAELGAAEIWLWESARSVGRVSSGAFESCRNQLIAGGKQSRNPWFPKLHDVKNLQGLLLMADESHIDWRVLPWEDQSRQKMLDLAELGRPGTTLYAIGPEGGFSQEEVDSFGKAGFDMVSLGKQVLRCETAAALCLGLHSWASQLPGKPNAARA